MLVPTLPQAPSIEESLLGALLMGTPYIHQVMQLSRDDDFYDQGLRNTFRAIVRLYNRGEEINAPLVYEELQRMLGPSEMYGDVLARILRSETSDHSALHMAQILQDYRQRRSMLTVGVRMQQWAAQMDQPLAESVEVLRRQFDGIMEGSTSTLTTLGQERQAVMQLVQDNLAGIKPPPGLMCGIRQLDDLGGLWDRGLVVVGAKSSHGKTMLMDLMALNVASQGRYVAYFSLEMGRDVVAARVMAMKSLVDGNRLRRKALDPAELARLQLADEQLRQQADSHLLFESAPSFDQMLCAIRSLHHKYPLAMVVIDYIQMLKITPATKDEVRAQTVGSAMHDMQQLGSDLHICFLTASQINRSYGAEPNADSLRDSGEIKEAADQVIIVWNGAKEVPCMETYPSHYRLDGMPVPTHDRVLLKLEKDRNGLTTYFFMGWIPCATLFCNLEDYDQLRQTAGYDAPGQTDAPAPGYGMPRQMVMDLPD